MRGHALLGCHQTVWLMGLVHRVGERDRERGVEEGATAKHTEGAIIYHLQWSVEGLKVHFNHYILCHLLAASTHPLPFCWMSKLPFFNQNDYNLSWARKLDKVDLNIYWIVLSHIMLYCDACNVILAQSYVPVENSLPQFVPCFAIIIISTIVRRLAIRFAVWLWGLAYSVTWSFVRSDTDVRWGGLGHSWCSVGLKWLKLWICARHLTSSAPNVSLWTSLFFRGTVILEPGCALHNVSYSIKTHPVQLCASNFVAKDWGKPHKDVMVRCQHTLFGIIV